MSFKLGNVIVDRLQFGYGAKSDGTPLYALTELNSASIDITADSSDITDSRGNLVYRKYTGKKGEVTATNAFLNLAIVEALSATNAEIASNSNEIVMPMIQLVNAGDKLDITGYEKGTVFVNAISTKGAMGKAYVLGVGASSATDFSIEDNATIGSGTGDLLTPPDDPEEVQYIVKYKKKVKSGAKITNSGKSFPKAHELFFKALVVDRCENTLKAAIIHIPSFIPSPECTISLQGGDSQTMDYKGSMMVNACTTDQELFSLYYIDEEQEDD